MPQRSIFKICYKHKSETALTAKSFQKPDALFSPAPHRADEASGGQCTAPESLLAQNISGVVSVMLPAMDLAAGPR